MDIVWVLAVMMFAALVQSLGGFGFALLAVPLAALAIDLKVAVIAVSVGSLFNTVILFIRTRKNINREVAWRFNVPAVLGMPIGLYVLANVAQRPLKIVLGVIIIVATLALMRGAANIAPRRWIEVLAGWLSGILSTATGTNGPPLVLAAQMRGLTPDVFRATLAFTFTLSGSLSLLMYVAARLVTRGALLLALAAVPLIVVGQRIGIRLQPRLSGRRFERLVYGLLLLSGTSIGVSGVLG
ncbi:MAG: sulfite exporter TauE/SafE family protein [Actinomycetota bacterium]